MITSSNHRLHSLYSQPTLTSLANTELKGLNLQVIIENPSPPFSPSRKEEDDSIVTICRPTKKRRILYRGPSLSTRAMFRKKAPMLPPPPPPPPRPSHHQTQKKRGKSVSVSSSGSPTGPTKLDDGDRHAYSSTRYPYTHAQVEIVL